MVYGKKSTETETTVMNEFNQISIGELENALNSSGNRKAPGMDNINTELRKYGSQNLKKESFSFLMTYGMLEKHHKNGKRQ
jgi:hypothetical protein